MSVEHNQQVKMSYRCDSCGRFLNRKAAEPAPKSCSYCHTDTPKFTVVTK